MTGNFEAGSITGKVDLDNEPAIKALRQLPGEAKDMKTKVENELKDAGRSGGEAFFKEIKGQIGRRSVFGETAELLRGGGAAIGLSIAGEALKGMADKAADLSRELREGKISAGEMVGEIASGLPIFGKFYEAGLSIREVFTGEKAAIASIKEEAILIANAFDRASAEARALKEVLSDIRVEKTKALTEERNIGATPLQKEINNLAETEAIRKETREKRLAGEIDSYRKSADAELAALRDVKAESEKAFSGSSFFLEDNALKSIESAKEYVDKIDELRKRGGGFGSTIFTDAFTGGSYLARYQAAQKLMQDEAALQQKTEQVSKAAGAGGPIATALNEAEGIKARAAAKQQDLLVTREIGEEIRKLAGPTVGFGEHWAKEWKQFADGAREARIAADDALHKIGLESRQYGMSAAAKELDNYSAMPGADQSRVDRMKEELKGLNDQIVKSEFEDPVDRALDKLKEAQADFNKGILSQSSLDLVKTATQKELQDRATELASKIDEPSYRLAENRPQRFQFGRLSSPEMGNTAAQRLREQHLAEAEKQTTLLQNILTAAQNIQPVGVMSAP